MAAKINWIMERLMRHCHPMYTFDYSEPFITATLGSIRPSVCPIDRQQQRHAAGLLLSVQRARDIDR